MSSEDGKLLSREEIGEICFRGYHVMNGYDDDAEATAKVIDSRGWLDEAGYLHISGRLKEIIIRGGENIYPREIEEFLVTHPDIVQVTVFGVPDTRLGRV